LVALRRPRFQAQPEEETVFPAPQVSHSSLRYPRWAVVSGVILYCSIFWLVVWFAGGWVLSLIQNGAAAQ
jgi:hypothetical protein